MVRNIHALVFAAAMGLGHAAGTRYVLTDMGSFGGTTTKPLDINAPGAVVGYSDLPGSAGTHGFLFANGTLSDVGSDIATGINDAGNIVGYSNPGGIQHGYLLQNGMRTDLGANTAAVKINNSDQIAVYSFAAVPKPKGYLYQNGGMTDLGSLGGGNTEPYDINNGSQIVGVSSLTGNTIFHAFLYSGGTMHDLGTLPGDVNSEAHALNDAGQVVGESTDAGNALHAFLFSGGVMVDLGSLGGGRSNAWSINSQGDVVGDSLTASQAGHMFLYRNGAMIDLAPLILYPSAWTLVGASAQAINDAGLIAGYGQGSDGVIHAFLLTPYEVPAVKIRGSKRRTTTNDHLVIRGTATAATTQVIFRVNKAFQPTPGGPTHKVPPAPVARGTERWHFTAKLKPGPNLISVTAINPAGRSKRAQIIVTRE